MSFYNNSRPEVIPTNIEIEVDPNKVIVSRTDAKGHIIYANKYFRELSGYTEKELLSTTHNIIRHPDMPKAIFALMWEYLKSGRNITAVVKNISKNGDHYWVTTDFEIKKDKKGKIKSYVAFRQASSKQVISEIEKIYQKLLKIEKSHNMEASIAYFQGYLQERHITYNQFIEELAKPKGVTSIFFEKMKKIFS